MSSQRLPDKALMLINEKPMLWHVLTRVATAGLLNDVVLATTTKECDKQLLSLAEDLGIKTFAGSENDVLDRFYQASTLYDANIIVRITGDCPLIDPKIIDCAINYFLISDSLDYLTNRPSYPDGYDVEVFSYKALSAAWAMATDPYDREHVTPFIQRHSELFNIEEMRYDIDLSHIKVSVDTEADLARVREIFSLIGSDIFYLEDVLSVSNL